MFEDALPEKVKAVLRKLTPIAEIEGFYLAGGTALALQIGHRISEDLDFFRDSSFDARFLFSILRDKTDSAEEMVVETHTLLTILEGARCSFFFYEIPLIFEPVRFEGLRVADWRDIVAEKLKTISQRGSKKDFFDIYVVLRANMLNIEGAVSLFRRRFESTGLNLYHVLRSLFYFEDAEDEPDPNMMPGHAYSWEEVKAFFTDNIREFETYFTK